MLMKRIWGPTPHYPSVLQYKGNGEFFDVAGPCSIESSEQIRIIAETLVKCGIKWMRGGVFRAGTYPRDNFGLQHELFKLWSRIARSYGLKIIVEIIDVRQLNYIAQYADAFQVGARHMQDYALLTELSGYPNMVTLKRSPGATLDEFLGAAEYLCRGQCKPVLIERGGASIHNHVRWDLSISLIAAVKRITGLPIIVDASHGTGRRDLVEPMTLAGIAAGADGFLIETHPKPELSLSDSEQATSLDELSNIKCRVDALRMMLSAGVNPC